jgi:hypothetical protein
MKCAKVITGVSEEASAGVGCENTTINTFSTTQTLEESNAFEVGNMWKQCGHVAVAVKRAREYSTGVHGLTKSPRVKRNVKWATELEEYWDGTSKKTPGLSKVSRRNVKPILKRQQSSSSESAISNCISLSSSEASLSSCMSDEESLPAENPRRLKFKLRYSGCGHGNRGTIRTSMVTLSI